MNDKTKLVDEQLSAFADGELPRDETALLLSRLARDEPLRARWARYHAIGETLRGGLPQVYPSGLAAAVRGSISGEPVHAGSGGIGRALGRYSVPLAGLAVAASVALVGVLVVRAELSLPRSPVAPLSAGVERDPALGAVPVDYSPALQAKLGEYVVRHGEFSERALPTVGTHVRVAARNAEEVTATPTAPANPGPAPAGTTPP